MSKYVYFYCIHLSTLFFFNSSHDFFLYLLSYLLPYLVLNLCSHLLIPFFLTFFTFFLTYFLTSFILFIVQEEKSEPRTTLFTSSGTTTADSLKGRSAIPLTKKVTKGIWLNFIKSWFIYLILSYFIQVCSKFSYFYLFIFNLL